MKTMQRTMWATLAVGAVGLAALAGCGGGEMRAPATSSAPSGAKSFSGGASAPSAPPADMEAPASDEGPRASADKSAAPPPPAEARPGLGTEWGETRFSHITQVSFVRADADSPFATASLFYNDAEGARAMANLTGFKRNTGGTFTIANGLLTIGLKDERGNFISGFVAGEKNYSIGENGQRYMISVHNNSDLRLEIVMSVDGLDVLDGKNASFAKRGYLVDPHGDVDVDGFRQSLDTVAAFRFGSVRDSYANQKHGDTRNVGVIGFAIFNERGTNPLTLTAEANRRLDANPFPGQFATPPGR